MSSAAVARHHLEAAADWHLRLTESTPTPQDQDEWRHWYEAADEHRQAWQRVECLRSLLADTPSQATKVLGAGRRSHRRTLLALLGVAVGGGLGYRLFNRAQVPEIDWVATVDGQQRMINLPDGGQLLVGAASRVGIEYGPERRVIHLQMGALQLTTGADARHRPLTIRARDGSVTPLGTKFTLVQYERHSVLSVQAHAVDLLPADLNRPVRVQAGERVRFSHDTAEAVQPASFADEAWAHGMLVAMNQPLARFLAEFQRQSGVAMSCDASIAALRVSGSFQVQAPQRSLATLSDQKRLRLLKQGAGWHLAPG